MILREYDVEEISYRPGEWRVIERYGEFTRTILAGQSYINAQNFVGILEATRQRFIEDNKQLMEFPEVVLRILEPDSMMNRPATVIALAECIRSGGRMVQGKCIKEGGSG